MGPSCTAFAPRPVCAAADLRRGRFAPRKISARIFADQNTPQNISESRRFAAFISPRLFRRCPFRRSHFAAVTIRRCQNAHFAAVNFDGVKIDVKKEDMSGEFKVFVFICIACIFLADS